MTSLPPRLLPILWLKTHLFLIRETWISALILSLVSYIHREGYVMFCGSSMPADMKSVSLLWWPMGLSEMQEGAHSKHSSVLTSILCFKTVSDWHPSRNLLWNTRQEGQGPPVFQQGYNPSIAEGPRTSGRAHCPWLQAPGGGKQFSLPPFLPCLPCKTPNSVLAEQALSLGLVWSQERFSFQPSHCPRCPWFLALDSVYPWRPHHSTLFLGSTGVAETSSHDLAGASLNFVHGHGHLIFI